MALTAELEALITDLEKVDPAAAKEQRALLEKFPALHTPIKESLLRQSDYSQKMTAMKADVEYGQTMREWWKVNKPAYEKAIGNYESSQTRVAQLEAEIKKQAEAAAAIANATGDQKVDPKALAAAVFEQMKDAGYASKTEIAEEVKKLSDQFTGVKDEFFKTTFPAASTFQSELTTAQLLYRDETGKVMDVKEFSKFMNDGKFTSPAAAFEKFMEPARTDKKIKDQAEARYQELIKQRQAEGFPGSSGPAMAPGHLQVRLTKKDPNDPLFKPEVELGDGSLGAMAAAELTAEGK